MPKPTPDDASMNRSLPPCGFPRRLLILLYDTLAVVALMMLGTASLLVFHNERLTAGKDLWYSLYLGVFWFLYLAWCWRNGEMTLGMRSWGVKLVCEDGQRLAWSGCFIRFFVSLVSVLALGAGFFWALFDPARRTWHDKASKTRLVRTGR